MTKQTKTYQQIEGEGILSANYFPKSQIWYEKTFEGWYWSDDRETYHGPFRSHFDAIEDAEPESIEDED